MYLDNMMNKKMQSAFYGLIAIVGMLIFVGGLLVWTSPRDKQEDIELFPFWSFYGFGPGIMEKLATVSGGLAMIGGAYTVWALHTNKLAVKRHSNLFQILALASVVVAIVCSTYDLIENFKGRQENYTTIIGWQSEHKPNPNPIAEGLYIKQRDLIIGVFYKMQIGTYIELAGASLSIVPICMFFGTSSFLWH